MRSLLLAATVLCATAGIAVAAPVSVIQLAQTSAGNTVTATNNSGLTGVTGATTLSIVNAQANIAQLLNNVTPINGIDVNMTATSVDNATTVAGAIVQHFDGSFCVSSGAGCTGVVFLSGSFTDAAFGISGGSQLTVNVANPPDTLALTSSVIAASLLGAPSSMTFGFTSLQPTPPGLTIGANQSINAFTASFDENVSASAVAIPEPSTLAVFGAGVIGLLAYRKLPKSRGNTIRTSVD